MTERFRAEGGSFLNFDSIPRSPPRLYVTAETESIEDFDQVTLQQWRDEGFDVVYIPFNGGGNSYRKVLKGLSDNVELGGSYAIVAFGDAASDCLDAHIRPSPRLCALIAYYPSTIPDPKTKFASYLNVVVHLASGEEIGVKRRPEILGIQGKPRTVNRRVDPGIGVGGRTKLSYPSYTYDGVDPGFAEHDLEEYDPVAARLSFSRSLNAVRKGFRIYTDLEKVWDEHIDLEFSTRNAQKTLNTMTSEPYVNHVPTLTGGSGKEELLRFYEEYFIPCTPPSFRMRLLSRTIGADHIVDEMHISFKHTQNIPWMLPGIPATNKMVEVALVSVVAFRGGKLQHEHLYWDQASVLVQLGLIDPSYIPEPMRNHNIKRLPVMGAESARKVLDEKSEPSNKLIPDWK